MASIAPDAVILSQTTGSNMAEDLPDDPVVLKKRIDQLEKELAKKSSFFAITGWQDALKVLAIPAIIWAFWDEVVLAYLGRDSASVEKVAGNIETLQSMDQELYVLQSKGDSTAAEATEAAIIARRERLVAETFEHWKNNPNYFRPAELQILTHHLIVQRRTDDAQKVYGQYWRTLQTPFEKAAGKLLEARIFAQEGPIKNLELARQSLRESLSFAQDVGSTSDRLLVEGQIVYFQAEVELNRAGNCTTARPVLEKLEALVRTDTTSLLTKPVEELRLAFQNRCNG